MPTKTAARPSPLSVIARDMRSALSGDTGAWWIVRRWAPDIDVGLSRRRNTGQWRLAATCVNGSAPDAEALRLLAIAFDAPDDWQVVGKQVTGVTGPRGILVAEVTWTERTD